MSNPASGQPAGEAYPAPGQQYASPAQPVPAAPGTPPAQVPYSGQPGLLPPAAGPVQTLGVPAAPYAAGSFPPAAYQPGVYQQAPLPPGYASPQAYAPQPPVRKGLARVPWPAWVAGVMVVAAVAMVALIFANQGTTPDDSAGTGSSAAPATKGAAANPNDLGCREINEQWPNLTVAIGQDASQIAGVGLDADLQQLSALMTDASRKSSGQTATDMLKVGTDADVMRRDLDLMAVGAKPADVVPFATDVPKLAADCGMTLNSDNDPAVLGGGAGGTI